MEFDPLLARVAKILDDNKIPYLITGGYAVSVWGRARATFDIDIVIHLVEAKIKSVHGALRKLSKAGYIDEEVMTDAVRQRGEFNYIYPDLGIKVDFFVKDDSTSRLELERVVSFDVAGYPVNFISPEDLILSKLRWHQQGESTRQLEDVASVIVRQKKLDWKYLKKWATMQNTWDELNKLKTKKSTVQ